MGKARVPFPLGHVPLQLPLWLPFWSETAVDTGVSRVDTEFDAAQKKVYGKTADLRLFQGYIIGQKALFYEVIRSWRACPGGMARNALFGAIGGMIIVGVAFMVPRLISETVIEPSGGASLGGSSVTSCDQVFKNQLVRNQAAGSGARMNQIKVQVQQRQEECAAEVWDPVDYHRYSIWLPPGLLGPDLEWRDLSGQGHGYTCSCCLITLPLICCQ